MDSLEQSGMGRQYVRREAETIMTAQEVRSWLGRQPFQPFRFRLNDGELFVVHHPELALIAETGALYVFEPSKEADSDVAGLPISCAIRNITAIEPVTTQQPDDR